jgi:uncharacterized membrane protein YoaT (DUF817 family)
VSGIEGTLWAAMLKGGYKRTKAFMLSFIGTLPVSFMIALSHRVVHYSDEGVKLETPIVFGWDKVISDSFVYWLLASGTVMFLVDWFYPNRVKVWNVLQKIIPWARPIKKGK